MERAKIDKWNSIVHFDETENVHTILFDGAGGAVISDPNLSKAKKKFIEAMHLAESVDKLINFRRNGSFQNN